MDVNHELHKETEVHYYPNEQLSTVNCQPQEEVMEFVNSIAHIVHTSVAIHGGAPNKNIGDAFLLVWKFPRGFNTRDILGLGKDRCGKVHMELVLAGWSIG